MSVPGGEVLAGGAVGAWPGGDLRRFLLSLAPAAGAAAAQLAVFAMTARALGPEAFGLLAAVYGVSVIATEIAGLGGDSAMVRTVAVEPARFAAAWGHALTLAALSGPPVVAGATALAGWLTGLPFATVAALVAGEVLVGRTVAACELALVARRDPVRASCVRLAASGARALLAALVLGGFDAGLETWALATLGQSLVLSAALLAWVGRCHAPPRLGVEPAVLGFGVLLMLNHLARALGGNVDRVLLPALLAPTALGLYAAAGRLQLLGGVATQAATRIHHPRFFAAAEAGARPLAALTGRVAAWMLLVGLGALAATALAALALPALLGPGYEGVGGVAVALACAGPFVALQYPPADALTARGRQGLRTGLYAGGAAGSAILLAAGAACAGLWGAAAAFVAGQAGLCAALWLAFVLTGPRR